jgi:protoporphyrinogen oxidase
MRVAVVGAGISGLTVALELARRGHAVRIFQREREIGGLLASFDLAGTTVERFYHFLCRGDRAYFDLCRELGLADRIRFRRARTGFFHDGRLYPFTSAFDLLRFTAIPPAQRTRLGLFAIACALRRDGTPLDAIAAKPWLIDKLGRETYDVIWDPLLSLKFGADADRIAAAWIWHRVHRVARSFGRLGYLEGGTSLLLATLAEALRRAGVEIRTGQPVVRLTAAGGRVTGLRLANGGEVTCDRVVTTLPLTLVADLLPEKSAAFASRLREVRYLGVACVCFKLRRPVTPNFWLNIHDPRIPFNGIIEFTRLNPLAGANVAYVPYYVPTSSATYAMPDDALVEQSWAGLRLVEPRLGDGDRIAALVSRAAFAQAICPAGFGAALPPAEAPLGGLHLLDSAYLYPEDRTQSGNILKARACAEAIDRAG